MKYRGLFLADIHIGAMSYDDTYNGITYIRDLLREMTKEDIFDFIIVGGDFFDKQIYVNDPFLKLAQKLMIYILASARVVRLINGTSSHDSDQYGIFDSLVEDIPELMQGIHYDFKVIMTVSEEELLPGMQVLYVPEEYIFDKEEYYKEYFNKGEVYDYVFGHGQINEAFGYIKPSKTKDHLRRRAPIFTAEELAGICKGDVIFGHYHIHSEYLDGKVSYVGSTFRWKYGEEEDKGIYILFGDTEEGTKRKEFLTTTIALKYITKIYGYKSSVYQSSDNMEKEAKEILKRKRKLNIDNYRLIFNIPIDYENPESFISFFKERFRGMSGIKLVFANGYIENEKGLSHTSIKEVLHDGDHILIDENVPKEDKIQYYLAIRKNINMEIEKIRDYLGIVKKEEDKVEDE